MKFEDMDVWKDAARLSVSVYVELAHLKDYGFRDQITRSGLSISSNIAEGFGCSTDKDERNFLNYARGSCTGFRSQTCIGIKAGFIDQDVGSSWVNESNKISAMLTRRMSYLSKKKPDERPVTNDE